MEEQALRKIFEFFLPFPRRILISFSPTKTLKSNTVAIIEITI